MTVEEETDESETDLQFEDTITIDAPKAEVWNFISAPENLVTCVPGAEQVERHSKHEYEFEIVQKIGPFTVTLDGEAELVEMNEPDWIVADGTAYDGGTGSKFDVAAAMEMTETADGTVELAYRSDLTMGGGIASVGGRIARRFISSTIDDYFDNIKDNLEGNESDSEVASFS